MSADAITGVLVLGPGPRREMQSLWFQYTRHDGLVGYSMIPVKDAAQPMPNDCQCPMWNYTRRNPFLDCSPSVRILGGTDGAPDHFHNSGQWSNHYVEMAGEYQSEPWGDDLCHAINSLATKEERDSLIFSYRAQGVLK